VATTVAALGQYALNVAIAIQNQQLNGQAEPATKGDIVAICGALALLAEAILVDNNTGSSGGGTIPNSLVTGKYSTVYASTTPIQV